MLPGFLPCYNWGRTGDRHFLLLSANLIFLILESVRIAFTFIDYLAVDNYYRAGENKVNAVTNLLWLTFFSTRQTLPTALRYEYPSFFFPFAYFTATLSVHSSPVFSMYLDI